MGVPRFSHILMAFLISVTLQVNSLVISPFTRQRWDDVVQKGQLRLYGKTGAIRRSMPTRTVHRFIS